MAAETLTFALNYSSAFLGADPDRLLTVAKHAEACGFEGLYVPEHPALYQGARIGDWEFPTTLPFLDPLDTLTFVAAATERLLLGTSVLLLPYHHPVPLAKRLAGIDVLSHGRMRLLTIGVGALPGEAAAVGVDYRTRGRRTDEAAEVLRRLWTHGADGATFHGDFFAFDNVFSYPQPLTAGGLPIHVGGSSEAAARRAGRLGAGWLPGGGLDHARGQALWDLVRSSAEAAGHDPEALAYTRNGSLEIEPEKAAQFAAQGVTRIVVSTPVGEPDEQCEQLAEFAERHGLGKS